MKLIQPFPGWRPKSGSAHKVAAPPYDVLSSSEARQLAQNNPDSFLHVSKAEINLDPNLSPYDDLVYQTAKNRFQHLCESGVLVQDSKPFFYIYRLEMNQRQQIGVVAAASVEAYQKERIRKHEFTRPDKENDRTRLSETLSAHTGPVFLTYRHSETIDSLVAQCMQDKPEEDFLAEDNIQHTLWVVKDSNLIHSLVEAFEAQPRLYVADGHHRSAAAARVCESRCGNSPNKTAACNRFLCVLFPDNQVHILDYNRVVRTLNNHTPDSFLEALKTKFQVTKSQTPIAPQQRHTFGLFIENSWYQLVLDPKHIDQSDPVASLDVALLSQHILQPLLDIKDLRRDKNIDFVGGIRGMQGLMDRVQSGEMKAAFSLFPTQLSELMTVADAGEVMPPKSTWFEPKLRDGLVVQSI